MKFEELRNPLKVLEELVALRDKGIITPDEFEQKKKEVLERI